MGVCHTRHSMMAVNPTDLEFATGIHGHSELGGGDEKILEGGA